VVILSYPARVFIALSSEEKPASYVLIAASILIFPAASAAAYPALAYSVLVTRPCHSTIT